MCILFRIWKIHIRRIRQYASGLREKKREQGKTEDIRRAMEQWQEAERYFKSVSDTDLVDYAVFEMEAARRKYMLLLKRYAEERKYGE